MPSTRFRYQGDERDVIPDGIGVGAATAYVPEPDQWSVTFRCLSDETKGELTAYVRDSASARLSDEERGRR